MDEKALKKYFANMNTLLHNVLNFHWNVTGGLFLTLHQLYNEQYDFLFDNIDLLAEIFKGKDIYPLTEISEISEYSDLKTLPSKDYTARDTLETLIDQYEFMNSLAHQLGKHAEEAGDLSLVDFFTDQTNFFNKHLYFLRQFLK